MYRGELQANLLVPDVVASVDFFRRVFGFSFQGYWDPVAKRDVPQWPGPGEPQYAELRAGNARIGLRPGGGMAPLRAPEFALSVLNADETANRIRNANGNPTTPEVQPWGAKMFSATDLNGYRWHFTEATAPSR
jgi:predicted enzyme related to lactoylglutathione lyase